MSNITYMLDAQTVGLPKWPAMVVEGAPVTSAQAEEILLRTDCSLPDFNYASNAHEADTALCALFGIPSERDRETAVKVDFNQHWTRLDALRTRLRKIPLEYLSNSQLVSAYVGGPGGWLSWEGVVAGHDRNIDKWPSVEAVATEWGLIAAAFPYLDLRCWLYDEECCTIDEKGGDARPCVLFRVMAGTVTVYRDFDELPASGPGRGDLRSSLMAIVFAPAATREHTHSPAQLRERVIRVYGRVPQYDDAPPDPDPLPIPADPGAKVLRKMSPDA